MDTVVPLIEKPRGLMRRYAWRYSRKQFGTVAQPVQALAHHKGVLLASGVLEMAVAKGWNRIDPHLRWLAIQAVSGAIGCSWCTDFGYYEGVQRGVDPRKIRDVPKWRESDVYSDIERVVLEFADVLTVSPAVVDEDLVARLHQHFDDEQIVELTGWIALENYRSRTNAGLGLRSQGFAAQCAVAAEVTPVAS
jgi:AhpD family alkylhydroperoxidase